MENARLGGEVARVTLSEVPPEPEMASLLATVSKQAFEIRAIISSILDRVSPTPEDNCCEKQGFSSGHIGTAEMVRSTQREAIELLTQLAKLV